MPKLKNKLPELLQGAMDTMWRGLQIDYRRLNLATQYDPVC